MIGFTLILFIVYVTLCISSTRPPHLLFSITRGTARSSREVSAQEIESNAKDYGLEYVNNIDIVNKALSHAATVIVMKAENRTLVSYSTKDQKSTSLLLSDLSQVHKIAHSDLTMILTGFIGDCNYMRRLAHMHVLNYSRDFESSLPIKRLGYELAMTLNKSIKKRNRPLITHCILVNPKDNTVLEIQPSGMMYEVDAVVIGEHSDYGQTIVDRSYRDNITIIEANQLASDILMRSIKKKTDAADVDGDIQEEVKIVKHVLI